MLQPGHTITLPTGETAKILAIENGIVEVQLSDAEFARYPISVFQPAPEKEG